MKEKALTVKQEIIVTVVPIFKKAWWIQKII